MQAVLSIAGSDSSGGAGIQADIKTIAAHHLFAETAITALTAQNTLGVHGVENVSPEFVAQQIDAVFADIRPAAVKIGMVSSPEIVMAIAEALKRNAAENIVVDPVMVATSGSALIENDAVRALVRQLFPLATVVTPNLSEAEVLAGFSIESEADMERAARAIAPACAGAVLVKGGHLPAGEDAAASVSVPRQASDFLLLPSGEGVWLRGDYVDNHNTHGTGCTLSSAIACGLAQGYSVQDAVARAKDYLTGALRANLNLGAGSGPLDHLYQLA